MGLWKSLAGQVRLELTGAQLGDTLARLNDRKIPVYAVRFLDPLTLEMTADLRHYPSIRKLTGSRGDRVRILSRQGVIFSIRSLLFRPVLLAGLILLLFSAIYIPRHVFFFRVEGNDRLPDRLILEKAAQCGLTFGANRREVRSEKLKNALLEAIPELQWAGINTAGCVAIVSVRERTAEGSAITQTGATRIVAVRDAVVRSCTVTRGIALCKVGQSVTRGQTLISGLTDCGRVTLQSTPEGEVMGQTLRDLTVIFPRERLSYGIETGSFQKIDLIIGKKRINLFHTRGLSGGSCGKIVKNYPLVLFGRFPLPVAVEVSRETTCEMQPYSADAPDLEAFAGEYLQQQMIAGSILDSSVSLEAGSQAAVLHGRFFCMEMIGRVQIEELVQNENNRQDRQR
ncbi:MAG: sporulation protein YqfD [Firmicutes bacterium]|nr:sporulation protein YqfD [Bacillota bacterium]